MRYLVTGGAGFIGSHLVDRLLELGHRVLVLDDLSTGRIDNLRGALGQSRFELCEGCVTDRVRTAELVARADRVVHLAAVVGVRRVHDVPLRAIQVNVHGTEAVLAAAADHGVPALYASSSEVYGDAADGAPFDESHAVVLGPSDRPRGGYACAKALGEWTARALAGSCGLPVVVARLFNTVGARQRARYGMVLPRLCDQAVRGEPLTVYGDGLQTRCFAHVDDVVTALIRLLETDAAHGRVVNVGSDREVSILGLAQLVQRAARCRAPIRRIPFEQVYPAACVDVRRRVPAVGLLEQLTGRTCRTPVERAIDDVLRERRARVESAAAGALSGSDG